MVTMLGAIAMSMSLFVADISGVAAARVTVALVVVHPVQAATADDARAQHVLAHLNAERAAYHCGPLAIEPELSQVAFSQAKDLADHHTFGHTSSDGKNPFERMDAARISYGFAAENVALDGDIPSAENALWHSPGHRENILGEHYAHVGIAFATEDNGQIVVVEDFTD